MVPVRLQGGGLVLAVVGLWGASAGAMPAVAGFAADELDLMYAEFRPLLIRELQWREVGQPQDLYKFLYQAVMGPAHVQIDADHAVAWLQSEWLKMEMEMEEEEGRKGLLPLLEPLRPDSQLVRVHLEPLVRLVTNGVPPAQREKVIGLAWERMAVAFSRTAEAWQQELGVLRGLWERVAADRDLWGEHFSSELLERFTREVTSAWWPAVHHSENYRERWRPHYRVVAPRLLPPTWTQSFWAEDTGGTQP